MAYRANPFLERFSERTTSDETFVQLFSPKVLDRLNADAFEGAVHVFRSPPGGGKTTLLRAFTPTALHAFWNSRRAEAMKEAYRKLVERDVLDDRQGPKLLGVLLSCASGYADLPPGAATARDGLFRALLDCRIVLRTLRSLATFAGHLSTDYLDSISLEYDSPADDLKAVPRKSSATELASWAETREKAVYAELDSITGTYHDDMPSHVTFEGLIWLQSVHFIVNGSEIAPKRLLMVDDFQELRRQQRDLMMRELISLRPSIPVWLAERTIAMGDTLLAQGARQGRDLREYPLDEIWSAASGRQPFMTFAQNILDRRLDYQNLLPRGTAFEQYVQPQIQPSEVRTQVERGLQVFRRELDRHKSTPRYSEWIDRARGLIAQADMEALQELYVTRILLVRDQSKRQMSFDLGPLSTEELQQRDSSQVQAAAELFMNEELGVPYYFGIERLCTMATFNVDELLSLAAALYEAILGKQMQRKPLSLSAREQEKVVREVAKCRQAFIPKNHTEGARAQRFLDAVGAYCRERTFLANAPYAPGVTGVRLSATELNKVFADRPKLSERSAVLKRVLHECVAENLLIVRSSAASTSRESGTIYYLNRMLCAHYGLPLQMGGWQDVPAERMADWMERGPGRLQPTMLEIE